MNETFQKAFQYLLGDEGTTFTDDPVDSGGATKFGVTQKAYELWLGHKVDVSEIKNMSQEMAAQFYFERYWKVLSCDKLLDFGIATAIFDSGVLYGAANAATMAQRAAIACGMSLKFDGNLGDKSIAALNLIKRETFLNAFHQLILARIAWIVKVSPKNEKYQRGWVNRGDRLLTLINTDLKK
jgi:lysozyme family protein